MELREYQRETIERAREITRRGVKRLVIVAPTGAGKTVIGARLVFSALQRGRRAIFVAHRRELITQTYRKLIESGVDEANIGVLMGDDGRTRAEAPIQVVSIATYVRRAPPHADLVLIDECHRSLSPSYVSLIEHYSSHGARVVGLTATPFRANGSGLSEVYEELLLVARPQQLIDQGFLVAPRVWSGGSPDLSGVHTRGGDYVEHELQAAMNRRCLVGGIVEHWQRLAEGRRTVAFASGVEHSRAIVAAFSAAGVPAEHLDGETPTLERDAILERLERGETLVVSNCGVLCEGWDMPACKALILARPTKSLGLYLQQAGRVLRPWNDVRPIILDHAGNALRHGLPQADRAYSLEGAKHEESPQARECPECSAVIAPGAQQCLECGFELERPRRELDTRIDAPGELRELSSRQHRHQAPAHLLAALENAGYTRRELHNVTGPQAAAMLNHVRDRRAAGLCTIRQARKLRSYGLRDDVSFELARIAIDAIAANNWRPPATLLKNNRLRAPAA